MISLLTWLAKGTKVLNLLYTLLQAVAALVKVFKDIRTPESGVTADNAKSVLSEFGTAASSVLKLILGWFGKKIPEETAALSAEMPERLPESLSGNLLELHNLNKKMLEQV